MYTLILKDIDKDSALDIFLCSTESKQIENDTYLIYDRKDILQDDLDDAYIKADIPFDYNVVKGNVLYKLF